MYIISMTNNKSVEQKTFPGGAVMQYNSCPACSGSIRWIPSSEGPVGNCQSCDGLVGEVTEKAYASLVSQELTAADPVRYFDFTVAGRRMHGWLDDAGRIAQIG